MNDFVRFRVLLSGSNPRERAERLVAETWDAGAAGHEELEGGEPESFADLGVELVIYAPCGPARPAGPSGASGTIGRSESVDRVWQAARLVMQEGDEISQPEPVANVDWSQAWLEGLQAIEVSERLIVRPSSVEWDLVAGQQEVVVDPGLAFGTGSHASTRLALDWICQLASSPHGISSTRVLDVGTGTGLLALAALRLGARFAVGFDIDPLAPPEALRWARRNSLAESFRTFTGPVEALAGPPFDLVLANLLRSELLPISDAVCSKVAPGGLLVLSGLLVSERTQVEEAMRDLGLEVRDSRDLLDDTGDHWLSLLVARP